MAATHSKSLPQGEFPQYAYALAILTGGIVFMVFQMGAPLVAWASYALFGTLLGFIWPRGRLQWGVWLCLPIILLICFDVVLSWSLGGLWGYAIVLGESLIFACLGAYVGSKLSLRNVINRSASKRVKRKRSSRAVKGSQNILAPKGLALRRADATTRLSNQSAVSVAEALEPTAHVHLLNSSLIEAVKAGDLNRINRLIADGADVNAKSREQWNPLLMGSLSGEIEMVETLFGEGAIQQDASAGQGWTPLMIATIEGRRGIASALLEHGAEVDAENNKGWTALRFAVSMDETDILRLLLAAGADANLADHDGTTALMQAATENSVECLKLLLQAGGADPRLQDIDRQRALIIAQRQGHTYIIKLLKEAEAEDADDLKAPAHTPLEVEEASAKTHRVIKVLRDRGYGSMARYNAIPLGAALPSGCEETGREGNEEECLDYAWRSSIDVQPKLAGLLGLREKLPSS
jgi:ankyrin repeat protein